MWWDSQPSQKAFLIEREGEGSGVWGIFTWGRGGFLIISWALVSQLDPVVLMNGFCSCGQHGNSSFYRKSSWCGTSYWWCQILIIAFPPSPLTLPLLSCSKLRHRIKLYMVQVNIWVIEKNPKKLHFEKCFICLLKMPRLVFVSFSTLLKGRILQDKCFQSDLIYRTEQDKQVVTVTQLPGYIIT